VNDGIQLKAAGALFIRALLGIIFLMQGYGKIFSFSVEKVYQLFFKEFEATFLPKFILISTAYFTSYVEMIGGFFLIIGLFRKWAAYFLALDLLIVSYGHGLMEPIWDLSHVIPRAILLAAIFFIPPEWDAWHLDGVLHKKSLQH
jgi:uncharacterized membrane protein YphA (DoxX/SURF4 family)